MNLEHIRLNKYLAIATFLYSFIIYMLTLAPTASFWDCGEFIAVAHGLQVTHPPGAPMFALMGRIFTMFMPLDWVAYAMNTMSALASAGTIMVLYLIIVRLIRRWGNQHPNEMTWSERFRMYTGGIIGSLAFAVSDTFWFSAVEAEVYAVSMLFTSLAVWLPLKWIDHKDEPGNERWLILIAYLFGLALGIHLLNILALFFVALIVYFEKREFEIVSFLAMGSISVVAFLLIYPGIVTELAVLAQYISESTYGLINPLAVFAAVGILLAVGIWWSHINRKHWLNIALLCYFMMLIGYSSYALIFIRSAANPPIDENDPETTESLISYLKREQYGNTPLLSGNTFNNAIGQVDRQKEVNFPRRYSGDGRHAQVYANYSSDFDYFIRYQINHMYIRYFNWNFIGRDHDVQDAGWVSGFADKSEHKDDKAHNVYFFLPFLLGLIGVIFHFQKDWKRALAVFVLFFITGLAIVIYLNQYPYQPRERDYAYVGSFFAFAIWIGIGATAILEFLSDKFGKDNLPTQYGASSLLFLAVPIWMLVQNFDDHDRSERYVAPDYAYNLLNSVEPYGILFTNGDNDTFPLWYLQEVEKVRTDVRVVCLSLLNTNWYIKQLKNQWSHESPPLPISYTDEQIDRLEDKFNWRNPSTDFWTPQEVVIPVDKDLLRNRHQLPDGMQTPEQAIGAEYFEVYSDEMSYGMPIDELDDEVRWFVQGRFLAEIQGKKTYYTYIQDDIIMDLLKNNKWVRPIYFATTVSFDGQLDMQEYFRLEGQAYRVIPKKGRKSRQFGHLDPEIHGRKLKSFRFREVDNEDAYFDENIRRMLDNYRTLITQQATTYQSMGKLDSAAYWMKWGEETIPFSSVKGDPTSIITYAYRYATLNATEDATRLANYIEPQILSDFERDVKVVDAIEERRFILENEFRSARANADLSKAKDIQNEMNSLVQKRNRIFDELSFHRSKLVLLQRIYYLTGQSAQAEAVKNAVELLAGDWIPFPADSAESARQSSRIQF